MITETRKSDALRYLTTDTPSDIVASRTKDTSILPDSTGWSRLKGHPGFVLADVVKEVEVTALSTSAPDIPGTARAHLKVLLSPLDSISEEERAGMPKAHLSTDPATVRDVIDLHQKYNKDQMSSFIDWKYEEKTSGPRVVLIRDDDGSGETEAARSKIAELVVDTVVDWNRERLKKRMEEEHA